MKTMMTALMLVGIAAFASTREDQVAAALKQARAAQDEAEDASGACRKRVGAKVDDLVDRLKELKGQASDEGLKTAKRSAEAALDTADDECSGSVAKRVRKPLQKVVASLDAAVAAAPPQQQAAQPGVPGLVLNIGAGLAGIFGGPNANAGASSSSSSHSSSTHTTRRTETVNGKPVDGDDDAPAAPEKKKGGAFGATCQHNADCESNTCFVGRGNLGYCTKMCDSWSSCPSFWECKRAANAPQTICMQGN